MRNTLSVLAILAVLGVGSFFLFRSSPRTANQNADGLANSRATTTTNAGAATGAPAPNSNGTANELVVNEAPEPRTFTERKAAHFVRSEPANNAGLAAAPESVTIFFDFTLSTESTISVDADGEPLGVALPTLSADRLSMSIPVDNRNGAGAFSVTYRACWPDQSCHDGAFGFTVSR
jgi:methionine-rich copper-binding protein CopC